MSYLWLIPLVVVASAAVALLWRPRRNIERTATHLSQAKRRFHVQRERLEAKFVQLAASRVGPNAPRFADCSFDDDVAYVRDRATGELSALVAVTIATEDESGVSSDAESLQAGTAVFRFDRDHWETDGRTLLNLSPSEAVSRLGGDLELVSADFAHKQ